MAVFLLNIVDARSFERFSNIYGLIWCYVSVWLQSRRGSRGADSRAIKWRYGCSGHVQWERSFTRCQQYDGGKDYNFRAGVGGPWETWNKAMNQLARCLPNKAINSDHWSSARKWEYAVWKIPPVKGIFLYFLGISLHCPSQLGQL